MNDYAWKNSRAVGSRFEALGVLGSKSWRKQTLIFFEKNGVCFLQFFDLSTPKASNRDPTAREYFTRNIFMILAP